MGSNRAVNIEKGKKIKEKNEIKILDIRSSANKRKTFSIWLTSCSKGLYRPIASYLQVCVQWNYLCLLSQSSKLIISKHNLNHLQIFVLRHIVFRTCNRTEIAGETNDYFATMRLQFKIVGVLSGQAPSPSPFASVTDWMLPSTPLKRCIFPNTTAQRHYSELQGCKPTEKMHYSS